MEQFVLVPVSVYNKKFEYPVSYQAGTSWVLGFTKSHVPNWFTWGDKQKITFQSRLFRQNFVLPTYQALKFADFNFGWCRNWCFTVRLGSTTVLKKHRRSRYLLYLTLLVYFRHRFWIKMPKPERKLGPFQNLKVQAAEAVHTRCWCSWVCAQLMES